MFSKGGSSAGGLRALSLILGVFFIFMGISKIDWLTSDAFLMGRFQEWLETAPAASRWFLQTLAIPGAPLFSRIVPIAEMAAGAAMVCGFKVRLAAALSLLMVLTFHFASDVLFHYSYLTNGYGLPVVSGLVALGIGGGKLPFSVSK